MTPTKESLDRARVWLKENFYQPGSIGLYAEPTINSLALEFDRVRLGGKKEILNEMIVLGSKQMFSADRKWTGLGIRTSRLLTREQELEAELAALNQPAGEKEG